MEKVDVVIIGSGIVGAAVASKLSHPQVSVLLLEMAEKPGDEITGRNSGVIHAGLYYPPSSLKAQTCVRGHRLLYEWCSRKGVAHRKCGKLVVATRADQEGALEAMYANALESGAENLVRLTGKQAKQRISGLQACSAVFSPETGIVDPIEFTQSLIAHAEASGAHLVTKCRVCEIEPLAFGYRLVTERGEIQAERVINAAGLYADEVAAMVGVTRYCLFPCRGDYVIWNAGRSFPHLVYPVKDPDSSHLGIHLTFDVSGRLRLGPNATYVNYKTYDQPPASYLMEEFAQAGRSLFENLSVQQLHYDGYGLRPKLRSPHSDRDEDFVIREDPPGFINLVGIDSPGLTAALAIAETVADLMK